MKEKNTERDLVYTLKNRCRVCYTCVRECPAKAIQIVNGQAEVLNNRCIVCGNCTKVCSQGAKVYLNTIDHIHSILESDIKKVAIVAPSFPAEFEEIGDYKVLVGMIKKLGFNVVSEVSFGADLVANKYGEMINNHIARHYISSDCPAIVSYVEHYHPQLIKNLVPIVSPMVAMTRVMHKKYGKDCKVIFIGPCVAKKTESDEVDEMITFTELREMFSRSGIEPAGVKPEEFDPPIGGKGAIFPVSRGLMQTAGITDDLVNGNVLVADGRIDFQEAIKEFEAGSIDSHHLELLACEGCIMGAGMSNGGRQYARRILMNNYVQQKLQHMDSDEWHKDMDEYLSLDLSSSFKSLDQRIEAPTEKAIQEALLKMEKETTKDHLNCGACGYDSCREHAIAIVKGLAEVEMCLPYSIEKLHKSVEELAISNDKLVSVQQALRQSEKMASMGQLSAGIAHELNNPLGVVIMYANILQEEADEGSQFQKDLNLIVEQTHRCKKIVGGLLNFARKNQVNATQVDLVQMVKESIDAVLVPENVRINIVKDNLDNRLTFLDHEQMLQVLTNIIKNAMDAMPDGGTLNIEIEDEGNEIIYKIQDSGVGIRQGDLEKIFEPFYTTKGIGKGTGLGLATAYGIVKMHKGKITVESNADPSNGDTGTTFIITIPRQAG